MSTQDEKQKRDGIARAAADLARASRGKLTYEQARTRVASAKARGDRIRNNNNE